MVRQSIFTILFLIFICNRMVLVECDKTDTMVVKQNLKRIINNALDALVNLEEKDDKISATGVKELSDGALRQTTTAVNTDFKKGDLLASDIKELETILSLADIKSDVNAKENALLDRQVAEDEKRERTKDTENESAENTAVDESREEKANVVVDNDNIRDLVDLVVRAIDEEARKGETKDAGNYVNGKNDVRSEFKKETVEVHDGKKKEKKKIEDKKEIKENAKDEKRNTLCNSRKRECVEKKEVTKTDKSEEDMIMKKTADKKERKSSAHAQKKEVITTSKKSAKREEDDSMEIREMVTQILDGKSEEEREAFASLLESVFERTKSSAADASAITKAKKSNSKSNN